MVDLARAPASAPAQRDTATEGGWAEAEAIANLTDIR